MRASVHVIATLRPRTSLYGCTFASLVVDLFEAQVGGEADEKLSESPLDRGNKVSTAVKRVYEHGGGLSDVDLGDDVGPLVQVGSATKDVGKIGVLATKVPGSNRDNAHHSGSLRKGVSNLAVRMDSIHSNDRVKTRVISQSAIVNTSHQWVRTSDLRLTGRDMLRNLQMMEVMMVVAGVEIKHKEMVEFKV